MPSTDLTFDQRFALDWGSPDRAEAVTIQHKRVASHTARSEALRQRLGTLSASLAELSSQRAELLGVVSGDLEGGLDQGDPASRVACELYLGELLADELREANTRRGELRREAAHLAASLAGSEVLLSAAQLELQELEDDLLADATLRGPDLGRRDQDFGHATGPAILETSLTDGPSSATDELGRSLGLLERLRKALEAKDQDLKKNPLIAEIELIRLLGSFSELDDEVVDAFLKFLACDSGPIVKLIESGKPKAESVLRLLAFLLAFRTEQKIDKLGPAIDEAVEKDLKLAGKSRSKRFARALAIRFIKKAIRKRFASIQQNINDGKLKAAAQAVQAIKSEDWPKELAQVLGKAVVESLKDALSQAGDAAARKVAEVAIKKILGSSAAGVNGAQILADLFLVADAIKKDSDKTELIRLHNCALLKVLAQAKDAGLCKTEGPEDDSVRYSPAASKGGGATLHTRLFLVCFCPKPDGKACEGSFKSTPLALGTASATPTTKGVVVPITPGVSGKVAVRYIIPAPKDRSCKGPCYIRAEQERRNKDGKVLDSKTLLVGVLCD